MKEIIDYFGVASQQRKLAEEVFELQEAITRFENGVGDIKEIIEELVDVEILTSQFYEYYEVEKNEYDDMWEYKKKRTLDRIKCGYYEK